MERATFKSLPIPHAHWVTLGKPTSQGCKAQCSASQSFAPVCCKAHYQLLEVSHNDIIASYFQGWRLCGTLCMEGRLGTGGRAFPST